MASMTLTIELQNIVFPAEKGVKQESFTINRLKQQDLPNPLVHEYTSVKRLDLGESIAAIV